ncbi:MAG: hypothetical protein ACXVBE_06750 [Bdellovibrionota bacterium]
MTSKFMLLLAGLVVAGGSISSGPPSPGPITPGMLEIVGKRGGGSSGDPGPIVDPLKEEKTNTVAGGRGGGGSGPPKNKEVLAGFQGKIILVAQPGRGGGGSGPPIL